MERTVLGSPWHSHNEDGGGGCKEAERTFVLVGGLESETPSSNLCTQEINWHCSVRTRYFPSLTAAWLNSNIEILQTILLLRNYLRHCNREFYLSQVPIHYFPASLIHIYSLVLLKIKINSSCVLSTLPWGCVGQWFTDPDAGSPRVKFVGSQYGTYSHQPSDAWNFEVAPRIFENVCILGVGEWSYSSCALLILVSAGKLMIRVTLRLLQPDDIICIVPWTVGRRDPETVWTLR